MSDNIEDFGDAVTFVSIFGRSHGGEGICPVIVRESFKREESL